MYRITKEFHLSASHQLDHLPADHQCARLHGHNYVVVVELAAENLNDDGFVRDYHDLSPLKRYIDEALDHRHLNDVFGHSKVTSEFLARHFYDWCKPRFPETSSVRVSETPKTWAEYRP
ncbi:6-carboxytetrahydropterin synthase QueD [Rhizobium ruizarguesonis]|jgi:6-pyruvoyltetrahydropterin/6-carboxytetrahydropterin synthase|uniref:6-carboxytetrahydropterin synthase QueD n=1 Tax=Rhizobium ruizarguesonis TaxID=2081791 RepID=UPI0010316ECA|nr:6-carboxytetrahydropterin synthase QueD [Rhizobium ruizarguesonis]MBY5855754.1 6-carboxytetrahydropterin synthase QueD [Rhizobium leguminosarum]QND22416.1 6-carboxytetrahydropterin synthase QueD [Rhizobium leguminosarum bv. viciae]MBY5891210.1 6-carboxytetrahydropterin synthase QueD [Rhizobium leguminosarum]QSZ00472.1 6-carboxytetrahydropterin synthase QueD [Rhizobium ruizarguesonis]TAW18135.1 6-carboxytetrahydropterin synthase QueD [Rhizobium ruizarguesonis]